ncbi:diaminobutyrate acetyltransferase, partial [Streptomyces sp. NPDC059558]
MTGAHADLATRPRTPAPTTSPSGIRADRPDLCDGPDLWRIARDAKTLDVNSPYSYLLWCRVVAPHTPRPPPGARRPRGVLTRD